MLPQINLDLSSESDSSDSEGIFDFFRTRKRNPLDTTVFSSGDELDLDQVELNILESKCPDPITSMVYIDDYNAIERISVSNAVSHITTQRRRTEVRANKSESQFGQVVSLANDIGMKVNDRKTQMLCIHPFTSDDMSTYIKTPSEQVIKSTESLKILGFHFNKEPNAIHHVKILLGKFYSKLWTIRFFETQRHETGRPSQSI